MANEEADESVLWLEVIIESGMRCDDEARALLEEAHQLRAMLAASAATSRRHADAQDNKERSANQCARREIDKSPNRQIAK